MIAGGRVQLSVADLERAVRFYVERLGVKLIGDARLDLGGGFEVELVVGPTAPVRLVLEVPGAFEEAVGTYDNRGLALRRAESYAECTDPDGHLLRFVPSATR